MQQQKTVLSFYVINENRNILSTWNYRGNNIEYAIYGKYFAEEFGISVVK